MLKELVHKQKGSIDMNTIITEAERNYILEAMKALLDDYNYDYSIWALNGIIAEWASQKYTLIEAFKKHPNYIDGKCMIAFDTDYTREIDKTAVYNFSEFLRDPIINMRGTLPESIDNR